MELKDLGKALAFSAVVITPLPLIVSPAIAAGATPGASVAAASVATRTHESNSSAAKSKHRKRTGPAQDTEDHPSDGAREGRGDDDDDDSQDDRRGDRDQDDDGNDDRDDSDDGQGAPTTPPSTPAAPGAPAGLPAGVPTFVGKAQKYSYGSITVTIAVSGGRVVGATATASNPLQHSTDINADALPKLNAQAVGVTKRTVKTKITRVSGATLTTKAYAKSLQAALTKARV